MNVIHVCRNNVDALHLLTEASEGETVLSYSLAEMKVYYTGGAIHYFVSQHSGSNTLRGIAAVVEFRCKLEPSTRHEWTMFQNTQERYRVTS